MACQTMRHVELLLEVALEREEQERAPRGDELHRGRQNPAWTTPMSQASSQRCRPSDVPVHLDAVDGDRRGIDARAAHDHHAQAGHEAARGGLRCQHRAQEMRADARAAHGDQADLLVLAPLELAPQRSALFGHERIEAGDVPAELEVLLDPRPDLGQSRPERRRRDVSPQSHPLILKKPGHRFPFRFFPVQRLSFLFFGAPNGQTSR